ncbi:YiiX/YebB-like N1pC/P60 family cysteine hydrolase [Methylocystis sp. JAN1]|uniref:YiiX/YebB-like N1pC/P60 family cysteine hydrolase n=1 Tax=Methylocystis sp. JAN1 TaxID=3397211 RepID=UPI003FA1EE51
MNLNAFLHAIGLAIARYLTTEVEAHPLTAPEPIERLRELLRPGDVLLIEGRSRISQPIKYLTQSTWSHAALFIGPLAGCAEADGEPHVLVEADLADGVRSSPLSRYRDYHIRICRSVNLSDSDLHQLIAFAAERVGAKYDLRNLFDLFRFLVPTPPVPSRWRRRFIAVGSGAPSRAICSTLIAEAFHSIRYPILPTIELVTASDPKTQRHVTREILHIRDSSLYTPRDFDLSPFFAVVKPELMEGFDYHKVTWA